MKTENIQIFFALMPLLVGIFLIIESETYGKYKMACFLTNFATAFDKTIECQDNKLQCDITKLNTIFRNIVQKNYDTSVNHLHFVPGLVFSAVGVLNLLLIIFAGLQMQKFTIAPSQNVLITGLFAILIIDVFILTLGINNVETCLPDINQSLNTYDFLTMSILSAFLFASIFVPAFVL